MTTVHVNASREYNVYIGPGLLSELGERILALSGGGTAALVSDTAVWPLYGEAAARSLISAGFKVVSYVFPEGEASKNGETYLSLLSFLAENHLTRSDTVIALGGGVVGDLAGFAAATYLRGIRLIQVPTTLLAAVDSSVGGKTAIDLPEGKNLAGAFFQPHMVVCDTDTLSTLHPKVFQSGCAEVIKYGVLYDPQLFSHLTEKGMGFHRETVISRCVELKRDVVAVDELDVGARMMLNLGHTLGHGIEALSGFTLSHGEAVAAGMAIISRAACSRGICDSSTRDDILNTLKRFGLPITTEYTAKELYTAALSDKKRFGETIELIVPESIGVCRILPTPIDELQSFIEAGL